MKRRVQALCVSLVVGVALGTPATADDRADLEQRLGQREIVVQSKTVRQSPVPRVTALALVDAPPPEVWGIVSDCERLQEVLESGSVAEELSRKGNRSKCRVRVSVPFGELVSVTDVRLSVKPGKQWRSTWTGAGGDFTVNDGSWVLAPFAGGTLVAYTVQAAPTIPIPRAILEQTQRSRMVAMLERLREVLER
ncbi:MAG: hypothetical protein AMXMBFR64_22140 [Myxococcales bacterium]